MNLIWTSIAIAWIVSWALSSGTVTSFSVSQARSSRGAEACREFVQGFYDWYVRRIEHGSAGQLYEIALNEKGTDFSAELTRYLRADAIAQGRSRQIVGIDFDPFLATNGPGYGSQHIATNAKVTGNRCTVQVFAVQSGRRGTLPVVTPNLQWAWHQWSFVNFDYGEFKGKDVNLLDLLRHFRATGEI